MGMTKIRVISSVDPEVDCRLYNQAQYRLISKCVNQSAWAFLCFTAQTFLLCTNSCYSMFNSTFNLTYIISCLSFIDVYTKILIINTVITYNVYFYHHQNQTVYLSCTYNIIHPALYRQRINSIYLMSIIIRLYKYFCRNTLSICLLKLWDLQQNKKVMFF